MGVGPVALKIYDDMRLNMGWNPVGKNVVDLGAQDYVPSTYRGPLYSRMQGRADQTVRGMWKLLGAAEYVCIDMDDNSYGAVPIDFNDDWSPAWPEWDLVTNHGTSEHIFNQRSVFCYMHDACVVGGLMLHVVPTEGYRDHGYYSYSSRFFTDLAEANDYETIGQHGFEQDHYGTLITVLLRRRTTAPFAMPYQKTYGQPELSRRDRLLRRLKSA